MTVDSPEAPRKKLKTKHTQRNRVFFDVACGKKDLGRIVFELFCDVAPRTCENFRALCTGEKGLGKTTKKPLHFEGVKFHRVIKQFMIQAGDLSKGDGSGGESIYGGQFDDETFVLKHDEPFLLSMANRGKNTNGSQFFVTTVSTPHLDGIHVVFGKVVKGQDVVKAIESTTVDDNSKPLEDIVIKSCGQLVQKEKKGVKKANKSERNRSETSGSDSGSSRSSNKASSDSESGECSGDEKASPKRAQSEKDEAYATQESGVVILPDEIPEVPVNKFLMRGVPQIVPDDHRRRDRGRDRKPATTKSGRKCKGRGAMRFRTPSSSGTDRSRSRTPPHWRKAQMKLDAPRSRNQSSSSSWGPSDSRRNDRRDDDRQAGRNQRADEGGNWKRGDRRDNNADDKGRRDRRRQWEESPPRPVGLRSTVVSIAKKRDDRSRSPVEETVKTKSVVHIPKKKETSPERSQETSRKRFSISPLRENTDESSPKRRNSSNSPERRKSADRSPKRKPSKRASKTPTDSSDDSPKRKRRDRSRSHTRRRKASRSRSRSRDRRRR